MVSGAGILSTAKNPQNAIWFLDFLLSNVAQEYFASTTFEYPLAAGISAHQDLAPLDEVLNPDIALSDLADLDGTQRLLQETGVLP